MDIGWPTIQSQSKKDAWKRSTKDWWSMSDANIAESMGISTTSEDESWFISDNNIAFVVYIHLYSHAYIAETTIDTWCADSWVSEHMMDRYNWFLSRKHILEGIHSIQIAENTKVWVQGRRFIHIQCLIDDASQPAIIQKVLYISQLKQNLFLIGLVSEQNISFITYPGRCKFRTTGKVVLKGTRSSKLYQLSIQVVILHKPLPLQMPYWQHGLSSTSSNLTHISDLDGLFTSNSTSELQMWHKKMCQVNLQIIHRMSR